jgi:hypothetical protein
MTAGSKRFVMVIGGMRTGTGWIYSYLRSHPSVYCSALKEWHFFDARHDPKARAALEALIASRLARTAKNLASTAKKKKRGRIPTHGWELIRDGAERLMMGENIEEYRAFFLSNAGDKDVIAELTPSYATLDRVAFREMSELSDDVRFVFIIRNPVDRAWSQICKAKPEGDKRVVRSFETALDNALDKKKIVVKSDYGRTLDELYSVVAPERVHVQLFEEQFRPEAVENLCTFMGIPYVHADFTLDESQTKGKKRTIPPDLRLRAAKKFKPVYDRFAKLYGDRLPECWRMDIEAVERENEIGVSDPSAHVAVGA